MKRINPRTIILGLIAIGVTISLFVYLSDAVRKSKAASDVVNINVNPQSGSFNPSRGESYIFIQTSDSSQKISGFDITINAKENLNLIDIEAPTFPGKTGNPVVSSVITRDISATRAHLVYVFQNPDADLPGIVQIHTIFRGAAAGSGGFDITNISVSGTTNKLKFDNGTIQAGTYTFVAPTSVPVPTNTPVPPSPTPIPTLPPGCRIDGNTGATVCYPTTPTNVTANTIYDASSISISWSPVAGATSYTIKRATTSGGPYIIIKTGHTSNTYTDSGLTHNQKYYYVVHAVNNYGSSAASDEVSALAIAAPTATPTPRPPTSTPTIIPTATPTRVPTATPRPCPKAKGDANCDFSIDLVDFEIWRKEFTGEKASLDADFNSDSHIDLIDYEIWRKNFFGGFDTSMPDTTH